MSLTNYNRLQGTENTALPNPDYNIVMHKL